MRADGRTDGQTDMTKLIVTFRSFTNAPKNEWRFTSTPLIFLYEFTCCQNVGLLDQYEQCKCGLLQVKSLLLNLSRDLGYAE